MSDMLLCFTRELLIFMLLLLLLWLFMLLLLWLFMLLLLFMLLCYDSDVYVLILYQGLMFMLFCQTSIYIYYGSYFIFIFI